MYTRASGGKLCFRSLMAETIKKQYAPSRKAAINSSKMIFKLKPVETNNHDHSSNVGVLLMSIHVFTDLRMSACAGSKSTARRAPARIVLTLRGRAFRGRVMPPREARLIYAAPGFVSGGGSPTIALTWSALGGFSPLFR